MKFHVARDACCSQDDQIGPLTATFDLNEDATLRELSEAVIKSGFLQFTSTHSVMVGQVGTEAMVRVFSPHSDQPLGPQYLHPVNARAQEVIGPDALHFRFVFDLDD